jgi:hypothetical protein
VRCAEGAAFEDSDVAMDALLGVVDWPAKLSLRACNQFDLPFVSRDAGWNGGRTSQ